MDYFSQESERLTYRMVTEKDIPSWKAFFIDNDRLEYMGLDDSLSAGEMAKSWIDIQLERNTSVRLGHLAVSIKGQEDIIGLAGIVPRVINDKSEFEIAYSLKPKYWGKGYGTEMAKHLLKYGEEHIDSERFISNIHKDNEESMHVARKNGMRPLFEIIFKGKDFIIFGVEKK